jgi:flagellar basal body-associated protein FliL
MTYLSTEAGLLKLLIVAIVVFLISACFSWSELVFLAFSRPAEAEVTKVAQVRDPNWLIRRGNRAVTQVEFTFTESDGTQRKGSDILPRDWDGPRQGPIAIRYIPGKDGSTRLAGHVKWTPLVIVVVTIGVMGVFVFFLWKEAKEANREWKRRKRW